MGKPTLTQLQEMNAKVPFEQGLYHTHHYEKLVKELSEVRSNIA